MRTALFIALLALAAPACRQHRYFVDMERAINETDDGKRANEDLRRELEAKQREVTADDADAKKAEDGKATDAAGKRARATETGQRLQRELQQHTDAARMTLVAGVKAILVRLADEKGVDALDLANSVAYVDPACDLTAELIKRVNAKGGKSEIDELRAKVQALEKKGRP